MVLALLLFASVAVAESPLNPGKSVRDNLQTFVGGKQVITVVLKNGKDYRAKVGAVSENAVLLTEISGRELFDVLVSIKQIAAIEAQARQP
jgi:ABC-type multidrug transport system ATPase subunit